MQDLLWKKFPVLDDGFICLVDVMGDDAAICDAARVSYGAGTHKSSDDRHLIRYLMRHQHMSPFEMCELKFMWRVPIDVWRQVVRHRTASINEYSTRYSIAIESANTTQPNEWRHQSTSNKQGSDGYIEEGIGTALSRLVSDTNHQVRRVYDTLLTNSVAREQARKVLPLATYTEAYWKIDLRNLLHFLGLRMEEHAQWEIRQYANIIGNEIVAKLFPYTWEAFNDFQLSSFSFTKYELNILCYLLSHHLVHFPCSSDDLIDVIRNEDAPIIPIEWFNEKCRERDEFVAKVCAICDSINILES